MLTGNQYRNYLLHQATTHPLLLHTEANLVFEMTSVEQAIGDLSNRNFSREGNLMRGIEPSYQFRPGGDGLPKQFFQGGYMIGSRFSQREEGSAGYHRALDSAEDISLDLVEKLYADSENGHPFFDYAAAESLTITSRIRFMAGDGTFAAWIILFEIELPTGFCNPATRAEWVDGGQTPLEI